eukprot:6183869-Pleurochrysis_carterae.AAC.1
MMKRKVDYLGRRRVHDEQKERDSAGGVFARTHETLTAPFSIAGSRLSSPLWFTTVLVTSLMAIEPFKRQGNMHLDLDLVARRRATSGLSRCLAVRVLISPSDSAKIG